MVRSAFLAISSIALVAVMALDGGATQASETDFPGSEHRAKEQFEQFPTVQWCDSEDAIVAVVEQHSTNGKPAASALWDELMNAGVCHFVSGELPIVATLIEEVHHAYVTDADPTAGGEPRQAIVEVWLAVVDGIPDHPVYIARTAWTGTDV